MANAQAMGDGRSLARSRDILALTDFFPLSRLPPRPALPLPFLVAAMTSAT